MSVKITPKVEYLTDHAELAQMRKYGVIWTNIDQNLDTAKMVEYRSKNVFYKKVLNQLEMT